MDKELGTKYLFQCLYNYKNNIRPANKTSYNTEGYKKLVEIAKIYFNGNELKLFGGFFQEYQYCVNLWTAHLILEYGKPTKEIKCEAIDIIQRYSETPVDEKLANEEKQCLTNNGYL